jgi:hypothetical protein
MVYLGWQVAVTLTGNLSQPIVGQVTPGGWQKREVQPHAIADARNPAMRCENPQADALPVSCDGERPVQDALWPVAKGRPRAIRTP